MTKSLTLRDGVIITALHLPALPGSPMRTSGVDALVEFAVTNAQVFAAQGVDALYLQNAAAGVGPKRTLPDVVAVMAIITRAVRQAVTVPVGLVLASYDAAAPLAIAAAAGAGFVRLKDYVGAMVKAEGIVEGCAYEALAERRRLGAEDVRILADIHDRTGVPLGPETLELAADWAARFGGADGLVITGHTVDESIAMLDRVRQAGITIPILCGGGVTADNVERILAHCDGVIVSSALRAVPPNPLRPWDPERIAVLLSHARAARSRLGPDTRGGTS
jgi:uncharacterized protein